jgi:5-methyltetrahydrofolate--homocysteine methyltransferase
MKNDLLEKAKEKTIVFDGAMGTMLMASGLPPEETPELWNIEKPSLVMEIHRKYYEAGSDVVQTNTFGGNPIKLADRGLEEKTASLNIEAAGLARKVCPEGGFVAGDIGPTGRMLKPLGDVSPEEVEEAFYRQASALIEGGVDFISIETMFSLEEALAAVRGAKRAAPILVAASITYSRTKNGFFTMMGESPSQCVAALLDAGADILGTNCTLGSREMIDLTKEIRVLTEKPLLIQPNAGKPISREGVIHYEQSPLEFARDGKEIREAGADMIGGCCGTHAEFIKELVKALA